MQNGYKSLPLKDMIRTIQNQLIESQEERISQSSPSLFVVDAVELELNFVIERSLSADAGANVVLVQSHGEMSFRKEEVHRIKLTLSTRKCNALEQIMNGGLPSKGAKDGELL